MKDFISLITISSEYAKNNKIPIIVSLYFVQKISIYYDHLDSNSFIFTFCPFYKDRTALVTTLELRVSMGGDNCLP